MITMVISSGSCLIMEVMEMRSAAESPAMGSSRRRSRGSRARASRISRTPLFAVGEVLDRNVPFVFQTEPVDQRTGLPDYLRLSQPQGGAPQFFGSQGQAHIFQDRQFHEHVHLLEGAAQPQAHSLVKRQAGDIAAEHLDPALGGLEVTADNIEQGRLSGAVGPDHPVPGPALDGDGNVAQGGQAAEGHGQISLSTGLALVFPWVSRFR